MPITRRAVFKSAAAAALVLTAGGGAFLMTRDPAKATIPWRTAGQDYTDPRLRALSYAILAPNPHNRQPWLIDLRRDDELTLLCDTGRLLPVTDPFNRQIVIGLGCFLELLRMAAADDGYAADITPFPNGASPDRIDNRPIATVRFKKSPTAEPDPLFRQALTRRSNKEPYDMARTVNDQAIAALTQVTMDSDIKIAATNVSGRVAALRDLTARAIETEWKTKDANLESVRLMRIGKAEIEANPDGIDLGGPFLETLNRLGLLTRPAFADPDSLSFQQSLDMFRQSTGSAMAHIWVTTASNSRRAQLAAGAAWIRINLKAAELGLGLQPLSQALQEYDEMRPYFDKARAITEAAPGQTLQMLGRLGYGPSIDASPRWPLETRLKGA